MDVDLAASLDGCESAAESCLAEGARGFVRRACGAWRPESGGFCPDPEFGLDARGVPPFPSGGSALAGDVAAADFPRLVSLLSSSDLAAVGGAPFPSSVAALPEDPVALGSLPPASLVTRDSVVATGGMRDGAFWFDEAREAAARGWHVLEVPLAKHVRPTRSGRALELWWLAPDWLVVCSPEDGIEGNSVLCPRGIRRRLLERHEAGADWRDVLALRDDLVLRARLEARCLDRGAETSPPRLRRRVG